MVYVAEAGGPMEEEPAKRQLHRGKQLAPPVRRRRPELRLTLTEPRRSGYYGPGWPWCSFIEVHLSGQWLTRFRLPASGSFCHYEERYRVVVGMGWDDWPDQSLELYAVRIDRCPEKNVVFRPGPHTSSQTVVLGRARMPLIDALVLGDDSDDDDEAGKQNNKRRSAGAEEEDADGDPKLVKGTRVFAKTVKLFAWKLPELELLEPKGNKKEQANGGAHGMDVGGVPADLVLGAAPEEKMKEEQPTYVVRGVVNVRMSLVE